MNSSKLWCFITDYFMAFELFFLPIPGNGGHHGGKDDDTGMMGGVVYLVRWLMAFFALVAWLVLAIFMATRSLGRS